MAPFKVSLFVSFIAQRTRPWLKGEMKGGGPEDRCSKSWLMGWVAQTYVLNLPRSVLCKQCKQNFLMETVAHISSIICMVQLNAT